MYLHNSFYEVELRDGYFVSEKMKRFWASSLEILECVNEICKKNGIKMYADYGTLLGAVRHNGFIPWDDDIDVSLRRRDYELLLRVLPSELPDGYRIYSHYNQKEHCEINAFVNNVDMVSKTNGMHGKLHGCAYPTGIDIFPIDTIPNDTENWFFQKTLYNIVYDVAYRYEQLKEKDELTTYINQIEDLCGVKFCQNKELKSQLWKLADRLAAMFREDEGSDLAYMADIITDGERKRRKKIWYEKTVELDFEGLKLMAPVGYLDVLRTTYENYQQAQRGIASHEYPVYKRYDSLGDFMSSKYVPEKIVMEPINVDENKVLFLIRDATYWSNMESYYKECKEKGMKVQIVVVPFQYKIGHNLDNWILQMGELSDNDDIIDEIDYHIEKEKPCKVYFHDPFDEYGNTTQVAEKFFLSNIRKYTKELIYIFPYDIKIQGIKDEMSYEMIKEYVKTPGFYLADEIKVATDILREFLVMTLNREFGKEATKDWHKIVTLL